jgi:hypothetical protein
MFAKIAAGVLTAVAVTGGGVYYATSDSNCKSCCPLSRLHTSPVNTTAEVPDCGKPEPSCSIPAAQNESLGACTGSATLVSSGKAKPAAHACCSDE